MARQYRQRLSPSDIDEIWRRMRAGHSMKPTARALGLPTSTVRSYLVRCGGIMPDPRHRARATRPKACKVTTNPVLAGIVAAKLQRRWSPQQIAGWLKRTYPDDPGMHVSHESIYRTLFVQSRGALRKELTAYLRTGRVIGRAQGSGCPTVAGVGQGS
jgi:IS30 family transposase